MTVNIGQEGLCAISDGLCAISCGLDEGSGALDCACQCSLCTGSCPIQSLFCQIGGAHGNAARVHCRCVTELQALSLELFGVDVRGPSHDVSESV